MSNPRDLNLSAKISGSLGMLGSLYIIADFLRTPNARKHLNKRLVFWMSVLDLFTAFGFFLSIDAFPQGPLCNFQGVLAQVCDTEPRNSLFLTRASVSCSFRTCREASIA